MPQRFKIKGKNTIYGYDTLYVIAASEEEAKQIALTQLEIISKEYLPISNISILDVSPVYESESKRTDYEVKIVYECGYKFHERKEKYHGLGPRAK